MNQEISNEFFHPDLWLRQGRGPRYQQLHRYLQDQIQSGRITANTQLPPERELADFANVSRVTVRQAISQLVSDGLVQQRRGSGSFILEQKPKAQQSLTSLVSFSETMKERGKTSESKMLSSGLFTPTAEETMILGLSAGARVARLERLRLSDNIPMALETSTLPENILHKPERAKHSLYDLLRENGRTPTRALQRISAVNLNSKDAKLLNMNEGAAALKIVRTGYLESGRPIEFTVGLYRSETYDFVAELHLND